MAQDKIKSLEKKLKALSSKPNKGASAREKVDVLNELVNQVRHSDPSKAEIYTKKALAIAKRCSYRRGIEISYLDLVWPHFTRGHVKSALAYASKALRISYEIDDKASRVTACKYIGIIYGEQCKYNKALEYLFNALKICKETNNEKAKAHIQMEIGNIYYPQNDYAKQLEYYLKALKASKSIGDKEGMALCHHNIGLVYDLQGHNEQALDSFSTALRISQEIDHKNTIACAHLNIAATYEKQKKHKSMLKHALKALKVAEKIGDKAIIAKAYGIIAVCKQGSEALSYYMKTLGMLEEIGMKEGIVVACIKVGRTSKELGKYDSACAYLQKGLKLAQEIGAKQREIEIYEVFSELYEVRADYRQALVYSRKKAKLEKDVINAETSKQIEEMKVKYETEKKEKEAEIYHLKNVKLRKEIRERRKIEKEIKKHRDQLEELVQDRTAQLRSLAHELSLVEEKQRRKIATYLHDEVNQKLALVALKLDGIEKVKSVAKIRKEHKEIRKIIDQAAQLTRSLTFEISPPILYEFGLEAAIEWLVRQFSKQHRIPCEFRDDGEPKPVTDDTRILLFQSVRELLANVSKHARANNVKVSTMKDDNVISIKVKDDGVGFDTRVLNEKIVHNEGFGLFNVMERLQHMKGRLEIKSKKGQGTSVVIVAPLKSMRRTTNRKRV
ncbi:sensor histidine kinase [bacterium]|nr:sensor histidine kinase [bacterium]